MPKEQKGLLQEADEISIKKMIRSFGDSRRFVFSKWKYIIVAMIFGGVIGGFYASIRKTIYSAECTFVLGESEKSTGGLGQYSALASMAGIDVGGGSTGLFQGDNITQLYRSRLMLKKTLLSIAYINGKKESLIDRYIDINKWREHWSSDPKMKNIDLNIQVKDGSSFVRDSLMGLIVADINKNYLVVDKPDKKLSMVSVKTEAIDPEFAKAFTENIVANVNAFYIQTKTKTALENVLLLKHQADSIHSLLNAHISTAARAADENPDPDPSMAQTLRAPAQRRQVDVQAASAIYSEVVRNLEIAKAALQRETPLIQVVDEPVLPLPNDRIGRGKAAFTGAVLAFIIGILWILTLKAYRGVMQ